MKLILKKLFLFAASDILCLRMCLAFLLISRYLSQSARVGFDRNVVRQTASFLFAGAHQFSSEPITSFATVSSDLKIPYTELLMSALWEQKFRSRVKFFFGFTLFRSLRFDVKSHISCFRTSCLSTKYVLPEQLIDPSES